MRRGARLVAMLVPAILVGSLAVPAVASELVVTHNMNGEKVVPGPGEPNGKGGTELVLKQRSRKICFTVQFNRIGEAARAEIHRGDPGESGPRKVTLFNEPGGANSPVTGCVEESADQIGACARSRPSSTRRSTRTSSPTARFGGSSASTSSRAPGSRAGASAADRAGPADDLRRSGRSSP